MSPEPVDPEKLATGRGAALTRPRPGHADLVGMQKYGFDEARPVLERASARETAARVALGAIAKAFLAELGITFVSHTLSIGAVRVPDGSTLPKPSDVDTLDADPLRCFDPATSEQMVAEVDAAHKDGDTLGGVVEVLAYGVPAGLGSYVQWDRKIDGRIGAAIMSIPAVKGVEIGMGFQAARVHGSEVHDEISLSPGRTRAGNVRRATNNAGGLEGGITTGEPLVVRVAMKPISTLMRPLGTVDVATGEAAAATAERSDVTAVPAMGVIAEAMLALVLADAMLEKFGGDSLPEIQRNLDGYLSHIAARLGG
jgi:chorismate synthase